jgi:Ran GTPase-activating protein (RanGAP) involved in mRNA processing and transport
VALCLSHCHIDDSKFDVLAKGVVNSNLKYLNISWNQLTKKSTRNLHDFIGNNEHLEKLMLQHNEFGAEPMDMVCLALAAQGNVRYIDISANNIGEKGFKAFAKFIASPASKNLEVFQCRRNEIGNVDNNVK